MKTNKIPVDEQETTYNIYPKKSGYQCEIYSCVPADIKQVRRLAKQYPDQLKISKDLGNSIFAEAPREWFKLKPPTHRNVTNEQRQELRERLAERRSKKDGE